MYHKNETKNINICVVKYGNMILYFSFTELEKNYISLKKGLL